MKRDRQDRTSPRRRWIIIGPGIVLAAILALQVAINARRASDDRPIIERQVIASDISAHSTPAPEVSYVLEHRALLALTENQVIRLKKLQERWRRESEPPAKELNRSAREFEQFMEKSKGKVSVQDIQAHAGEVSELSRRTSSLRRIYWERALQALDSKQRSAVENALSEGTQRELTKTDKEEITQ